jgi:hypothetical protein
MPFGNEHMTFGTLEWLVRGVSAYAEMIFIAR